MKLITLLLFTLPIFSQTAVYNNFSPTVQGITVGNYHCYLFMHTANIKPYEFESACYKDNILQTIQVSLPGVPITQFFNFSGGYIGYLLKPNSDGTYLVQLEGKGPDDATELQITKNL